MYVRGGAPPRHGIACRERKSAASDTYDTSDRPLDESYRELLQSKMASMSKHKFGHQGKCRRRSALAVAHGYHARGALTVGALEQLLVLRTRHHTSP